MVGNKIHTEGELFQVITIEKHRFELRYGYYEEADRLKGEPVLIYPDLTAHLLYTEEGFPLVTAIQVPCEYYIPSEGCENEECCSGCRYYPNMKDEIGICQCKERKI